MRGLVHNIGAVVALSPAVQAASINGNAVDRRGFGSMTFVFLTGAIAGAGLFTPTIEESDNGSTGWTTVPAANLMVTLPTSLAADSAAKVGLRNTKRYVRPVLTKVSGTSIAAGVLAIRGHAEVKPAA